MPEITEIQSKIRSTIELYEKLVRLKSHIAEIDNNLSDSYARIKLLDKKLDSELKDIEALEKIGIKSLFYRTLGSKEEQLDKERQEYLDLSLHFNELKKEVELMEYEKKILTKKILELPTLEKELPILKQKRKEEILIGGMTEIKAELMLTFQNMDVQIKLKTEIGEAIREGNKCIQLLDNILNHLSNASDWGKWDMRGNDRRAGYMRKKSIDNAINILPSAQHQLNLFLREMNDLEEENLGISLQDIHFNRFKDFFFDNLISDWIIQQRIKNTYYNIESTQSHIKRIILSLGNENKKVEQLLKKFHDKKEALILS